MTIRESASQAGQVGRNMRPERGRRRTILTPDGVALGVDLADRGERAAAVLIDLVLMGLTIVGASLLLAVIAGAAFGLQWSIGMVILTSFVIRSFYFIVFELRWQGQTPGKRSLRIRVIDRGGGRLTADSIFARNLMRELELFLPVTFLASNGASGWADLLTLVWLGVFALMPLFNRDRMRAGDMVAGTWVVAAPESVLYRDLAAPGETAIGAEPYTFTREQVEVYGIYELQTLEAVLRQRGRIAGETRRAVYERIARKTGWRPPPGVTVDSRRFLDAYYAALRANLESGLLMGRRRENKHDRDGHTDRPSIGSMSPGRDTL